MRHNPSEKSLEAQLLLELASYQMPNPIDRTIAYLHDQIDKWNLIGDFRHAIDGLTKKSRDTLCHNLHMSSGDWITFHLMCKGCNSITS